MLKLKNSWATDIFVKDSDMGLNLVGTRVDDGDPLTEDFMSDGITEITEQQYVWLKSHADTAYYFDVGILSILA